MRSAWWFAGGALVGVVLAVLVLPRLEKDPPNMDLWEKKVRACGYFHYVFEAADSIDLIPNLRLITMEHALEEGLEGDELLRLANIFDTQKEAVKHELEKSEDSSDLISLEEFKEILEDLAPSLSKACSGDGSFIELYKAVKPHL